MFGTINHLCHDAATTISRVLRNASQCALKMIIRTICNQSNNFLEVVSYGQRTDFIPRQWRNLHTSDDTCHVQFRQLVGHQFAHLYSSSWTFPRCFRLDSAFNFEPERPHLRFGFVGKCLGFLYSHSPHKTEEAYQHLSLQLGSGGLSSIGRFTLYFANAFSSRLAIWEWIWNLCRFIGERIVEHLSFWLNPSFHR